MSETAPGQHWATAAPGALECGDGPFDRYCPVYWAKRDECEALRALVGEICDYLDRVLAHAEHVVLTAEDVAGYRQRAELAADGGGK